MTVTESLSTEDAAFVREIVAVNEGRAALYRVLAHYYFKELTAEEIEKVASQDFAGMDGGEALIAEGFADMKRYLEKRNTGTRQALAVDYAHTFLAAGNYESFAATPYESVFTSELGLLMQEARDEVYKCYCEEGIQPDESLRTSEGHLSFGFEFIACLLDRTNEALRRCDGDAALAYAEKIASFHRDHQLNWVDALCDAIIDVAETRFYRGVSKVTRGFVHMETDVIADEVQALKELKEAFSQAA